MPRVYSKRSKLVVEHSHDGLSDENKTAVGVFECREIVLDGPRFDDDRVRLDVKEKIHNGLFDANKTVVSMFKC